MDWSKDQERRYKMLQAAMVRSSDSYNAICVGKLPEGVNYIDTAKSMYPMWYREIQKIETGLNDLSQSDDAYQKLCERYVNGWTKIFTEVTKQYTK